MGATVKTIIYTFITAMFLFKAIEASACHRTLLSLLVVTWESPDMLVPADGRLQDARDAIRRRDLKAAYDLLLPFAFQGDPVAQTQLGLLFEKGGDDFPPNERLAMKWFHAGAQNNEVLAQARLGVMLENGEGIPEDPARAVSWYREAAAKGIVGAHTALGRAYFEGHGILQDFAKAAALFLFAAKKNSKKAQYYMARMLRDGLGVKRDLVRAYMWAKLAEERYVAVQYKHDALKQHADCSETVRMRESIEEKLTESQIQHSKNLLKNWRADSEYKIPNWKY